MALREAEVKRAQCGRRLLASKCKSEIRVAFRLGRKDARWVRFVLNFDETEVKKRCLELSNLKTEPEAERWAFETWEGRNLEI
ncbi:MAG TPA: hypothetical protein VMV27_08935 [Candidatus Binataceae bacterium]|nr:hypothetical protein [Candidatus Binataceae bacterium]